MTPERAAALLREVEARWNDAADPLDAAMMAGVYTRAASFFGGRPELYEGEAGIFAYFASYRDMIAAMRLNLEGGFVHCAADMILFQGHADFTFYLASGRTTKNRLRATLALAPEGEGWKIALHHFSPPPAALPVPV